MSESVNLKEKNNLSNTNGFRINSVFIDTNGNLVSPETFSEDEIMVFDEEAVVEEIVESLNTPDREELFATVNEASHEKTVEKTAVAQTPRSPSPPILISEAPDGIAPLPAKLAEGNDQFKAVESQFPTNPANPNISFNQSAKQSFTTMPRPRQRKVLPNKAPPSINVPLAAGSTSQPPPTPLRSILQSAAPSRPVPQPISSNSVPQPTPSRPVPQPISSNSVPQPTPSRPVPQPISSNSVPQPTPSRPFLHPVPSRPFPQPISSRPVPQPISSRPVPQPIPSRPVPPTPARNRRNAHVQAPPQRGVEVGPPPSAFIRAQQPDAYRMYEDEQPATQTKLPSLPPSVSVQVIRKEKPKALTVENLLVRGNSEITVTKCNGQLNSGEGAVIPVFDSHDPLMASNLKQMGIRYVIPVTNDSGRVTQYPTIPFNFGPVRRL